MSSVSVLPAHSDKDCSPLSAALKLVASGRSASNDKLLQDLISTLKEEAALRHALSGVWHELVEARNAIHLLTAKNRLLREKLAQANHKTSEALAHACYDELTGLPNRRLLKDRLQQAIAHATRHEKKVALLLIDMDGFKGINDSFGHSAGDQLLRHVARRLGSAIRVSDTACRYGGDEFIVVVPDLDGELAVNAVIDKLYDCLKASYLICGREMEITASIGCAVYPDNGQTSHDLINRADAEMYRVKALRHAT